MTRFTSDALRVIPLALNTNDFGFICSSLKASIKYFKEKNKTGEYDDVLCEFLRVYEELQKQGKNIVLIY